MSDGMPASRHSAARAYRIATARGSLPCSSMTVAGAANTTARVSGAQFTVEPLSEVSGEEEEQDEDEGGEHRRRS